MNDTAILMTGIGGQGVQLASKTLAYAAIACGMEAMVFGTFGGSMRGGNTDVDMVISSAAIRMPPVLDEADAALVMHHDGWAHVAARVRPGGVVVVDSSVFRGDWTLPGVRVVPLPASTMALELGQSRGGSMVALGAFVTATGLVPLEALLTAAQDVLPAYRRQHVEANQRALKAGHAALAHAGEEPVA
jgi:Pyruvate/2-oxoacid:ferredoxin oxidoreductase gamma subunit